MEKDKNKKKIVNLDLTAIHYFNGRKSESIETFETKSFFRARHDGKWYN